MKKHRNKKLILQISIITLLIFAATLAYSILTDYSITKDSYLS
jgi:sensor domain CHASE-containing protein